MLLVPGCLQDENWRCCYKALLLLEHLLKHGPAKIVPDVQSSASVIERLTFFEYKVSGGRRRHALEPQQRRRWRQQRGPGGLVTCSRLGLVCHGRGGQYGTSTH